MTASANYYYYEAFGKEASPNLDTNNALIYKPIKNRDDIKSESNNNNCKSKCLK